MLGYWPRFLAEARPRRVKARDPRLPVLLFTDGAEEGTTPEVVVSIGAVIVDPEGADVRDLTPNHQPSLTQKNCRKEGRKAAGGIVPDSVVRQWCQAGGTTKVIHQAEIYPAVVGVKLWSAMLAERRVILFIDKEVARRGIDQG